jgi:hypothetical protein
MQKYTLAFTDQFYKDLNALSDQLGMPKADVVREALSTYRWLVNEKRQGHKLLIQRGDQVTELLMPKLEQIPQIA